MEQAGPPMSLILTSEDTNTNPDSHTTSSLHNQAQVLETSVPSGRGAKEGAKIGLTHEAAHAALVPEYESFVSALPVSLQNGDLIIHSLGRIDPRGKFHSFRYIWPIGYTASRRFASVNSPGVETTWKCCITDDGSDGPRFVLTEEGSLSPAAVSFMHALPLSIRRHSVPFSSLPHSLV